MQIQEVQELNRQLADIEIKDTQARILVDTVRLPFIQFEQPFLLPQVKLHDIQFDQARTIVDLLVKNAPALVQGCHVLPEARPRRDTDQLHLVRKYSIGERDYIFILKIVLKFMGGAYEDEIVVPGVQGVTPAFHTDRLYFHARAFPFREITEQDGAIVDFQSLHIRDAIFKINETAPGTDIWSSMLFDEVDFSKINRKFTEMLAFGTEWKLPRLFWPFNIEYLSLCFNFVHADRRLVDGMMPYFHRAFEAMLPGTMPLDLSAEDQSVWRYYYDAWSYEPFTSRGGNPHWVIKSLPDHEEPGRLAEQAR